jgi:hypothetical protein
VVLNASLLSWSLTAGRLAATAANALPSAAAPLPALGERGCAELGEAELCCRRRAADEREE